jgi:hypothetical protein
VGCLRSRQLDLTPVKRLLFRCPYSRRSTLRGRHRLRRGDVGHHLPVQPTAIRPLSPGASQAGRPRLALCIGSSPLRRRRTRLALVALHIWCSRRTRARSHRGGVDESGGVVHCAGHHRRQGGALSSYHEGCEEGRELCACCGWVRVTQLSVTTEVFRSCLAPSRRCVEHRCRCARDRGVRVARMAVGRSGSRVSIARPCHGTK